MDYLFYGFMWAFFWEWFTLQQGKPNDDIGRLMHLCLWPFFMALFIIGFINGQNNEQLVLQRNGFS